MKIDRRILPAVIVIMAFAACAEREDMNTQPPVSTVETPEAANDLFDDPEMSDAERVLAEDGRALVASECQGCHQVGSENQATSFVGLTERRDKDWIMDFVMNRDLAPEEDRDEPVGSENCAVRQPGAGLDHEEALQVVAYLRTV